MKKSLAILLAVVMTLSALCFVGCDKGNTKAGGTLNFKYSEYYKQSLNFEEYKPHLEQFLNIIKKAYDASDKKTFSTFKLDDNYQDTLNKLLAALTKPIAGDDQNVEAYVKSAAARTNVNTMVADMVANIGTWQVNTPETVDEALFREIDKDLNNIMNELANGNG